MCQAFLKSFTHYKINGTIIHIYRQGNLGKENLSNFPKFNKYP